MKVRCIYDLGIAKLEVGKIYEGELKFSKWWKEDRWYIKGFEKLCFREHAFEMVKEDNMEKTFREVIADIKEGEVWIQKDKRYIVSKIANFGGDIVIESESSRSVFGTKGTYILERKKYTFEEAFKAYEDGIKVESVFSGVIYEKLSDGTVDIEGKYAGSTHHEGDVRFLIGEIRGKWYINN